MLIAAVFLLWMVVVLMIVAIVALLRQINALYRRLAQMAMFSGDTDERPDITDPAQKTGQTS